MTKKELEEVNELRQKYQVLYEIHQEDVKLIKDLEEKLSFYEKLEKQVYKMIDNINKLNLNIETIEELQRLKIGATTYEKLPIRIKKELEKDW